MGRGPVHLLENGIAKSLREQAHEVEIADVLLPDALYSEGQALAQLQRGAVPILKEALEKNQRALLLSGNCGPAALSAVSALGPRTTGVIWFDAHGDFNTPETSASGFLDGMALSILTGRCWPALAASFEGFEPVPERILFSSEGTVSTRLRKSQSRGRLSLTSYPLSWTGSSRRSNISSRELNASTFISTSMCSILRKDARTPTRVREVCPRRRFTLP